MRRGTSTDVGEGRLRRRHTHLLAPVDPGQSSIHTEPCLGAGSQHARVCRWPAGWKTQSKRPPPLQGLVFPFAKCQQSLSTASCGSFPTPTPPKRDRGILPPVMPSAASLSLVLRGKAECFGELRVFWGGAVVLSLERVVVLGH